MGELEMDVNDVPDGHWILFNIEKKVIYHNKEFINVLKESEKYNKANVTIQMKYSKPLFSESGWT